MTSFGPSTSKLFYHNSLLYLKYPYPIYESMTLRHGYGPLAYHFGGQTVGFGLWSGHFSDYSLKFSGYDYYF